MLSSISDTVKSELLSDVYITFNPLLICPLKSLYPSHLQRKGESHFPLKVFPAIPYSDMLKQKVLFNMTQRIIFILQSLSSSLEVYCCTGILAISSITKIISKSFFMYFVSLDNIFASLKYFCHGRQ